MEGYGYYSHKMLAFLRPHFIYYLLMTYDEQSPSAFSQADAPQQQFITTSCTTGS